MEYQDQHRIDWWERNLADIDREIGRMAALCHVQILAPGVIDRVIAKDATVCGTAHPAAFQKLHDLMIMHLMNREKAADELGLDVTASIETYIVERMRRCFPDLGQDWPPH